MDVHIANKAESHRNQSTGLHSLDFALSAVHGPDRTHTVQFGSDNLLGPAECCSGFWESDESITKIGN
jgi:hypothetical protein